MFTISDKDVWTTLLIHDSIKDELTFEDGADRVEIMSCIPAADVFAWKKSISDDITKYRILGKILAAIPETPSRNSVAGVINFSKYQLKMSAKFYYEEVDGLHKVTVSIMGGMLELTSNSKLKKKAKVQACRGVIRYLNDNNFYLVTRYVMIHQEDLLEED